MAARKRRRTPTKRQKTQQKYGVFSRLLGGAAFLALGCAALIGWWPDLMDEKTPIKTAQIISPVSTLQQLQKPSQTNRVVHSNRSHQQSSQKQKNDEIRDLITVGSVMSSPALTPSALMPPVVTKPQQKPLTPARTSNTLPPVPYKEDENLPPAGQFGVDNAATRVFAKDMLTVFAEKNEGSKIIATLSRGQEMRLYETDAGWQRIVVPSSDIIGWVMANSLTTTNPTTPFSSATRVISHWRRRGLR